MRRLKHILIALDQLVNTLLGGWPDETLSSRAYRWSAAGKRHWPMRFLDVLFFWEVLHCYNSYLSEANRTQLPPSLRGCP
jgi:hypothetical protein